MKSADNIPGVGSLVEVEGDKPLKLGALIKSGGAGSIYQLPEAPELVAKIYHAGIDLVEYEHKVRAMLRLVPDLPDLEENGVRMPQIAWPSALLRDQAGGFCGFLMPRLDIDTTIELEYMLQERQARAAGLPTGLGSRLTLAANLSSLIVALHRQKHYVVDLKPVNIRFYRHALYLAVLDCDGFSIGGEGERYPAPQYTPDYLAPEFHKTGLQRNAEEQQDRFALAVIIFQLLNFGIHPYAGSPLNDQVPTDIPGRIAGCYYAYALRPHSGIRPNPASGHEHFPPQLRKLFDRAFGGRDEPRPSAAEWVEALAPYAQKSTGQLVVCQNDKEHQHFAGQDCAACARNAFMAKVVSAQELMAGSQQQATVAKASKVATPASAPVPPPKPAHLPKHTTPASAALSAIYKTIIASIALPIMAILTFWGLLQLFSMLSDSFASSRPTQHNTKATVATLVSSTTSTTQTANSFKVGEVFKDCKDCPGMVALPSGELAKSSPQSGPPAAQVVGMSRAVPQGFALHPDRRTLASLRGGGVELSDLKTLTITRKLGIDAPASSAVIFSPDGNLVAVGHEQGEVSVWRLDGRRVARVKGHMDRVVALAFSPDGKRLATGGYDGSVQVWPTTTWNRITTIDGVVTPNSQAVLGVQFSSDGQFLYVLETLYDNDERINPRTRVLSAWKTATWTEVGRLSWRLKYMDYKGNPNPLDVPFTISNWGSPQLFVASDDGHGYPKKVVPPTASKLRSITVGGCFPEIADPEALPPSDSWATAMTAYSQKGWLAAAYLKGESYEYSPGIALIPLGKGQAGRNWQTSKQSIQLAFDGGERLYSLSTDGQIIAWNLDSLPSLPTEKTSQISEATDRCSANTPVPVTQIASTKKRKALSQVAKWQLDPELKKTLLSWQSDFPSRLELVGEKLTLWGPRGRITLDAKTGSVIERDVPLANDSILISGASSERYVVRADSLLVVDKATGAQRLVEQNPGWRLMAASVAGDYVATSWQKSSGPPPHPVEFHILSTKSGEKHVIQPVPFVSMNHGVFATIYSPLSFMLTSDGSWLGYQVDGEFGYWVLLDTKTGKDFKLMKPLQSFEGPRLLEHDTRWMGLRVFNVETAQYEVLMRPHPSRIPSDNARRPHKQRFLQGAISAGARYALSGAFDGSVKLWDVVARAEVAGTGKTGSAILANGFDRANENRFFSLHWDGTFTLWQIKGSSQ